MLGSYKFYSLKTSSFIIIILLSLLLAACDSGHTSIDGHLEPSETSPTGPFEDQTQIISWQQASEYIGKYAIVTGMVVLTYYAEDSNGEPTFLNFHDPYEGYFTCIIWGDDRELFPDKPEVYYLNRHVQVRGFITEYEGAPEMIIRDESQIRLTNAGETWEESTDIYPTETIFEEAKVTDVIDGDTIKIEGGEFVRYIGIDTPETVHSDKPVECFGPEASDKNHELVAGKSIRLEGDIENRDQYGRLLRYVYVDDLMINAELIRWGYAEAIVYPPNTKYTAMFLELEQEAQTQGIGLWGACVSLR